MLTRAVASGLSVAVMAALVTLVLWLIIIRPKLPVSDKLAGLLQLLAVYTALLGLLSGSGFFNAFHEMERDVTSSDPLEFLRGNFLIFTFLFGAVAAASDPRTVQLTQLPMVLASGLALFGYAIIHFVVIAPVAYFAYLVTSAPIDAILNSGSNVIISITSNGEEPIKFINIKALVVQNESAIRNFAVALPAFTVSFFLKLWPLLRRS